MVDPTKLRRMTEEARELIRKRQKEAQAIEAEDLRARIHRQAWDVISFIQEWAEKRATEGFYSAATYHLPSFRNPEKLTGAEKIIFDYCEEKGLKPTIEKIDELSFHGEDKYAIIIHW